MIEKSTNRFGPYQKKIVSYLDGSLSPEERSEFEAFVSTNPEFESVIKIKEEELLKLKQLIPSVSPTRETLESIDQEMKLSIFNLLKEEPRGFFDQVKNFWEEWIYRPKAGR